MSDAERIPIYLADPMAFFADLPVYAGGPRFGDIWTVEQREFLEKATPCLLAIARRQRPPIRGIWFEGVKGAGKDTLAALCVLWLLCFAPWAVVIQIAADDQQQGGEVKRALSDWIAGSPWIGERVDVQRWRVANEATGAVCEVLTSDASGSHGARPNMVVLNEVSHIENETFAGTIADNFTKMPDAFGLFCTNAGYLGSWQWRWRELYRVDPRWHFIKITTTPPWQSPADIEEARRRNPPARFRRLYCGEWVAAGGDALPADAIERCIVHTSPLFVRERHIDTLCGIGVDAGLATHHASVVVVVGSHDRQKLRVAKVIDICPPCRLDRIRDEVERQANTFCTRFISADVWQMMRVAEELVAKGYTVLAEHQTGAILTRQAAALLEAVRDGVLELYPNGLLLEDLYGARIVEKSYGQKVLLAENENGHSDRLAALLQVLPHMLTALGHPYTENISDGLGNNIFGKRGYHE